MRAHLIVAAAASLLLAGCATTGATFNSGVGDRFLDEPPYRAGAEVSELMADLTSRPGLAVRE